MQQEVIPPSKFTSTLWQEWPLLVLLLVVLAIYSIRLGDLSLRGEETRRARIGIEMMESGDWLVPRQQGEPFLSRPPLQNWIIALLGYWRGDVDIWAIRLPSLVAMLLLSLMLYGFTRTFLRPEGALATGLVFATMGQVMELGRLAETDILLSLFITGSLLAWKYGDSQEWSPNWTWSASYVFVALATLVKGPQGVAYFGGSVGLYLLLTNRWRVAFSRSHLLGILVFLVLWGAWQIPYTMKMGWVATRAIYGGDVALRFEDSRWLTFWKHLVTFPVEVIICTMPWSLLLIAYAFPSFRQRLGPAKDTVFFLTCCLIVTFPTCWLVPGAKGRYFLPMYPCVAILAGIVIERCWQLAVHQRLQLGWLVYRRSFLTIMLMSAFALPVYQVFTSASGIISSSIGTIAFSLCCLMLAGLLFLGWNQSSTLRRSISLTGMAGFLGLGFAVIYTNIMINNSVATETEVASLIGQLPADVKLYSFGPADHIFAYYYRKPIKLLPRDPTDDQLPQGLVYFCSGNDMDRPAEVRFKWKTLATISCDRRRMTPPQRITHVGMRENVLMQTMINSQPLE